MPLRAAFVLQARYFYGAIMRTSILLSSAAVLHVLAEQVDAHPAGTVGLLFALGPGVTSELVLLRWADGSAPKPSIG